MLVVEQQRVARLRAGECFEAATALLEERAWEKAVKTLETGKDCVQKYEAEKVLLCFWACKISEHFLSFPIR